WIIGVILLITVLWVATESEIAADEREQRAAALQQAESLAGSYALQLTNYIEQLDQLSLNIAFNWVDAPQRVDLRRDRQRGLFPARDHFFVAIVDANGTVMSTSMPPKRYVNLSTYGFFQHHHDVCCDGLRVTGSVNLPLVGMRMTLFSRRIDDKSGRFAGMVLIAVQPNFLTTFQDEVMHEPSDFSAALLNGSEFISTRLSRDGDVQTKFFIENPVISPILGSRFEPGTNFSDGVDRIVGWRKLDRYPLVAITGLAVHRALAGHHVAAQGYRSSAIIATVFLTVLAIVGIWMSLRYAARRRAEEDVRRTYRMATDAANEGFYMLTPV
ncbi:MAG: hypothetical protein ACKO2S_01245, partial [Burkholderiaceae bacterium]